MNNLKIYGGPGGWGGEDQGAQKFWRNLFAGSASARFHRPTSGLGLSERAQANLRSMRMLTDAFDFHRAIPHGRHRLLWERSSNGAHLSYRAGEQYAVSFPGAGSVTLDLTGASGALELRWLDVGQSRWVDERTVNGGSPVRLAAPGAGLHVALLTGRR